MKINLIGEVKTVLSNPGGFHNYFGWPSIIKAKNGNILVGASGYRLAHTCPFGKLVMAVSENEGEDYSLPYIVVDSPLDDRDVGLCAFGENGVISTCFHHPLKVSEKHCVGFKGNGNIMKVTHGMLIELEDEKSREKLTMLNNYSMAYLNGISEEEERNAKPGSYFCISFNNGKTFSEPYHSPITSPHGPTVLNDGTVLWVGTSQNGVEAYTVDVNTGKLEFTGAISPVYREGKKLLSCEPYALQLESGKVICHIRVQSPDGMDGIGFLPLHQSESVDGGKTWSEPKPLEYGDGARPAHLLLHSSGAVISTFGYRDEPFGVKAMVSYDEGKTWSEPCRIYENNLSRDIGYPMTAELSDGSLLTVFYAHKAKGLPAEIYQQKWKLL